MLCKTRDHLKHALHGEAAEPHGDLDFTAWGSFSEVFCFGGKQRTECVRAKAALQISPPVLGYCGSAASLQQADSRMGPLLGDHVRWTGTRSGRAQSIKGTRCSSSVPAHSWPPLPQPKKRIFITTALRKDAQSCSLEAGSWRCESSAMLRAYKCPLTNLFFLNIQMSGVLFFENQTSLEESAGPTNGRQSCCDRGLCSSCPLSHSSGRSALVTIGIHFSTDKLTWVR